jgi:hypothetical protein
MSAADPLEFCPTWCTGDHSGQEPAPADRFHECETVVCHLGGLFFEVGLEQHPYATRPGRRGVRA